MTHTPDRVDEETGDERIHAVDPSPEEPGQTARDEEDPAAPEHEKLIWVLVWTMGIIGAIILIVWTGMLLFIH